MARRSLALAFTGCIAISILVAGPAQARSRLAPVTHAALHATTYSIKLSWHRPADSRVKYISISRVSGSSWGGPPTPSGGFFTARVPARTTSYYVTDLLNGTYTYAIFARSGRSKNAAYSKPVFLHGHVQSARTATKFQAVYATPKNVAFKHREPAIRNDIARVLHWYDGQTGGRHPRFARRSHGITVRHLRLSVTAARLESRAGGHDALADVRRQLARSGTVGRSTLAVVYVEGIGSDGSGECGVDGGALAILWMHACNGIYPRTHDTFPYGATYLAAHEMTHALGAAPGCAKHSTGDGHVRDSRRDVLYEGPKQRDFLHLVLDYRHDDYYRTGSTKCLDIARDHVWVR